MRRYKGTFDILFGLEHSIEEGGDGGAVPQRILGKDGDLQRMQRELQMKKQAVRIVSTRREESSSQSVATWESQSLATKEELPQRGLSCKEVCVSSRCTSGTRKAGL